MEKFKKCVQIYIIFMILISYSSTARGDTPFHHRDVSYDVIIVGGGISGLTAAYMLRDSNILLLERDKRFGGRIWTEKIDGVWYNIGTQFLMEDNNSLISFLDDIKIKRIPCPIDEFPTAVYLKRQFYGDLLDIPLSIGQMIDVIKVISISYRKLSVFKLPPEDPRWQELAGKSLADLFKHHDPHVMNLFNAYLRGACATRPENTSAGIGVMLMGDIFLGTPFSFVKGGTQKITDTLVEKLQGRLINEAVVRRIEERDGYVYTFFLKDGREHVVKSKKVVIAVPAPIALKLIPDAPDWKKEALSKTMYGSIITVNIFLKKIPWKRFNGMLVGEGKIFNGVIDATYSLEFATGKKERDIYPKILSFFISTPPEDIKKQRYILSLSDVEIVKQVIRDFKTIISEPSLEDYIQGSRVTRFPVGEVGITPEYFTKLLPLLKKPVGNIHFCGDYTDRNSFLMGSVLSSFRVARELGSKLVVSKENEIRFAESALWGVFGWLTIILNAFILLCGTSPLFMKLFKRRLPKGYGILLSVTGLTMLIITLVFPYLMPPYQMVYLLFFIFTLMILIIGFIIMMLSKLIAGGK